MDVDCCLSCTASYPGIRLRWSDAYGSESPLETSLALNRVLQIYDTLNNAGISYDESKAREHFLLIAKNLDIDPAQAAKLDCSQQVSATLLNQRPNIVYVILESLGSNEFGGFGNPHNPTSFLDDLAVNGTVFDRCSIPTGGGTAARSLQP